MKESDNIELYLLSFETEMPQIGVEQDHWKSLITVRLTAKMKAYICDILGDPTSSYQERVMLACIRTTMAALGQQCYKDERRSENSAGVVLGVEP